MGIFDGETDFGAYDPYQDQAPYMMQDPNAQIDWQNINPEQYGLQSGVDYMPEGQDVYPTTSEGVPQDPLSVYRQGERDTSPYSPTGNEPSDEEISMWDKVTGGALSAAKQMGGAIWEQAKKNPAQALALLGGGISAIYGMSRSNAQPNQALMRSLQQRSSQTNPAQLAALSNVQGELTSPGTPSAAYDTWAHGRRAEFEDRLRRQLGGTNPGYVTSSPYLEGKEALERELEQQKEQDITGNKAARVGMNVNAYQGLSSDPQDRLLASMSQYNQQQQQANKQGYMDFGGKLLGYGLYGLGRSSNPYASGQPLA